MTRHTVNRKTRRLVADSEGFRGKAYRCPAGIWTIGFGFTKGVKEGDVMTREEAEARLDAELAHFADGIRNLITGITTENQFGAMVSLAFNIGVGAFSRSTVLRLHNAGDYEGAARAFGMWVKAGGRVLPGLVRRRAAEAALYLEPVIPLQSVARVDMAVDLEDAASGIAQQVDEERPLRQSRIVQSAGISGGVAGLTLASEAARSVADIRTSLGDWLPYIALAVVVLAAGWTIYERVQQRRKGIA